MSASDGRRDRRRLLFVFGSLYFVQGIAEPTEGLITQPVRSLLRSWGHDAAAIGLFATILSIPWFIKPLFGLLTDFVPIFGARRKGWLVVWTAATTLSLLSLWVFEVPEGAATLLLVLLMVPTVGIAFTDVVVDALMVEEGQPRGLTGTLQSVQWGAAWVATILTGFLGGELAARGMQRTGFLLCGLTALFSLGVALTSVREPPAPATVGTMRGAVRTLVTAGTHPAVVLVALFLFVVNFNPFGSSVTYVHMTESLGLGESLYGQTVSVRAVAAVVAAALYGVVCRRLPFPALVWGGIALAVASTLCWYWVTSAASAYAVAAFYGFTYMITSLVQFDIAARYSPPAVAGTVFAILMSVSNLSTSLAEGFGGWAYTSWSESMGEAGAYHLLVVLGALFTALAFVLVPRLRRLEAIV